jgi:hypothetical protein
MTIGPGLKVFLLADSAISTRIGGNRIYPVEIPQKPTLPLIRYTHVSGSRVVSTTADLGLSSPRMQIDAWAATYKEAAELADLILKRLSAFQGYFNEDTSPPSVYVQGVFMDQERDGFEPETKLYFFSRDYFIHYEDPLT